jgi:uncharacterized protein (DUF1501 family)
LANAVGNDDGNISQLRKGFRGAGRLLAAAEGPRIAVLCIDGWDTHVDQGGTTGIHADLLAELDLAIGDFRACIGTVWPKTVMICATEFGRTVRTNGDEGTDHGVGTLTLLAGGAVNGGQIFGDWPGLAPANLYEGSDLTPATDLRSVFKGVLSDHLGVPASILNNTVFPGSADAPAMGNLIKASAISPKIGPSPKVASPKTETAIAKYRREQRTAAI